MLAIPNCKHHGCSSRVSTVILKRLGGLNKASLDYFRGTRFYRTPQMHCSSSCLQWHIGQEEANSSVACAFFNTTTYRWSTKGVRPSPAPQIHWMLFSPVCVHAAFQIFNLLSLPSPPHRRVASTNVSSDTQGALNHRVDGLVLLTTDRNESPMQTARVEHGLNIQMHLIRQSFNSTQSNPNAFDHLLPAGVAESTLVFFAHLWVFLPCWFCA